MKVKYSYYLENSKDLAMEIVNELSKEFKYISILATDVQGKTYRRDFNTTSINDSMINERGFVARVYNGKGYAEYSFNNLNERNKNEVKNEIRRCANEFSDFLVDSGIEYFDYDLIEEEPIATKYMSPVGENYVDASDEEIVVRQGKLVEAIKEYSPLVINALCAFEQVVVSKAFYSNDRQLEQVYTYSTAYQVTYVMRDEVLKYAFASESGMMGFERFDIFEQNYKKYVDEAIEMLDLKPVKEGEYDIICNPTVSGLIAHEAFGHGVEMDMFVKNRAKGAEYIGEYVASKKTNMHDGAQSAVDVASYLFDDEGVFGTDTKIIDKGILKAGISDLLSATKLGTTPTGNGRRESFERKAYARMTNTFFANGEDDLDEMIKSIKYGFLLEDYSSGMEDPKNWGIQCIVSRAREIVDGEYTGKIFGPIMLTGYVPDILRAITAVSKTDVLLYGGGYCGKGYKEWAKTSIGGVYLKTRARLG